MQPYLALISKVMHESRDISAEEVWRALCRVFCEKSPKSATLFQNNRDYYYLTKSFCDDETHTAPTNRSFTETWNNHFQFSLMSNTGEFSQMLEAFLTCFPKFIYALDKNITQQLPISPYRIMFKKNDLATVSALIIDNTQFIQPIRLLPLLIGYYKLDTFKSMLNVLILTLGNVNYVLRRAADVAWQQLKTEADIYEYIISFLLEKIKDNDIKVRKAADIALTVVAALPTIDINRIVPALIGRLGKDGSANNEEIFLSLLKLSQRIDADANAIAYALATSGDCSLHLRHGLAEVPIKRLIDNLFERKDIDYDVIFAVLQKILQDNVKHEKIMAALFLGFISRRPELDIEKIVSLLLENLHVACNFTKAACIKSLEIICDTWEIDADLIIAALTAKLFDSNEEVVDAALIAISKNDIKFDFTIIITNIIIKLENGSNNEKMMAANTLGKIAERTGQQLAKIISALLLALNSFDLLSVIPVIKALCGISNRPEVLTMDIATALMTKLHLDSYNSNYMIIDYLGEISSWPGVDTDAIVTALQPILRCQTAQLRQAAANTLMNVCQQSDANLKKIFIMLLQSVNFFVNVNDFHMQTAISGILRKIFDTTAADVTEVLAYILELLPSANLPVRELMTEALCSIAKRADIDSAIVASALIKQCADRYNNTRVAAVNGLCHILKRIDIEYEPIFAALVNTLKDDNVLVRKTGVDALTEIALRYSQQVEVIAPFTAASAQLKKRKRYEPYNFFRGKICIYAGDKFSHRQLANNSDKPIPFVHLPALIPMLLPMLNDPDECDVQISVVTALASICEIYADTNSIESALIARLQITTHDYIKKQIIDILVKLCEQEKSDTVHVLTVLTDQLFVYNLDYTTYEKLADTIVSLYKNNLSEHNKDYYLYGILLHKYYSTDARHCVPILEVIARICQLRSLEFEIDLHLPLPLIVNTVTSYLF